METVPIESVVQDPEQPRKFFGGPEDEELKGSIKAWGLLQPPVVTSDGNGRLIIVNGERRYRACKALGWTELPVTIREDVKDLRVLQLIENLQRKDLNALEEAQAIKNLIDEQGYTQKKAAKLLNKSQVYVSERLAILNLPPKARQLVLDGKLSFSHAKLITKAPSHEQDQLAQEAADNKTTVKELNKEISGMKSAGAKRSKKREPDAALRVHLYTAVNRLEKARQLDNASVNTLIDEALGKLSEALNSL